MNREKTQIISMEYKQFNKSRRQNFICTIIVLGCLFFSQSAFSQNGEKNLLNSVTEEPCCDAYKDSLEVAVEICPNPDTKDISVAFTLLDQSEVTVSLVNLQGEKIEESQRTIQLIPGNTILNYQVSNLKRGAYLLMAEINGYIHTRIVNIQKSKSKQAKGRYFGLKIASFIEINNLNN